MQTWKCIAGFLSLFLITGCAPKALLKADCHSCTVEEQEWRDFAWSDLRGYWRGSVETWKNERDAKKRVKNERAATLYFASLDSPIAAGLGLKCPKLPQDTVVMNGLFWGGGAGGAGGAGASNVKEFDAFMPVEDDRVAYGRVRVEKVNGEDFCQFHRFGRVMGKNRLNLPSVSFSDRVLPEGRVIAASSPSEKEISVEFLRFESKGSVAKDFSKDNRRPASKVEAERPALMIRVFQTQSQHPQKDRGELSGTDEQIYRLWKMN